MNELLLKCEYRPSETEDSDGRWKGDRGEHACSGAEGKVEHYEGSIR